MGSQQSRPSLTNTTAPKQRIPPSRSASDADSFADTPSLKSSLSYRSFRLFSPKSLVSPRSNAPAVNGFHAAVSEEPGANMAHPRGPGDKISAGSATREGFGFRPSGLSNNALAPGSSNGGLREREGRAKAPVSGRGRGLPRPKSKTRVAVATSSSGTSPSARELNLEDQFIPRRVIPCASVESLEDASIDNATPVDNSPVTARFGFRSNNNNNSSNIRRNNKNSINNNQCTSRSTNGDAETETTSPGLTTSPSSGLSLKSRGLPIPARGRSRLLGGSKSFGTTSLGVGAPNSTIPSNKSGRNFQFGIVRSPKPVEKTSAAEPSAPTPIPQPTKSGKAQSGGIGKIKNSGFGFRYDGIKSRLMPPAAASRAFAAAPAPPPIKSPNERIRKELITRAFGFGKSAADGGEPGTASLMGDNREESVGQAILTNSIAESRPASTQSSRRDNNHFSVDGLNFIDASSSEDFVSLQSSDVAGPIDTPVKSPARKAVLNFNNNLVRNDEKASSDAMVSEKVVAVAQSATEKETIAANSSLITKEVEPAREGSFQTEISEDDDDAHEDIEIVDPESPIPKTNLNLSLQSYSLEEDVETPLAPPTSVTFKSAPVVVKEKSFVESASSRSTSPLKKADAGVDDESKAAKSVNISRLRADDLLDLGKGSSVEEEEAFPKGISASADQAADQSRSVSDSDFVESDDHPMTRSQSDADAGSINLPDIETLSSCSLDSNDLMLDVDNSVDDTLDPVVLRRRKDSSPARRKESATEPRSKSLAGGDMMTYNEEGGGDGHFLDGLDEIREELDLLQRSLDISSSTAGSSPKKKTSGSSSSSRPSNGGLMDSHPSVWSCSKVTAFRGVDKDAIEQGSSASPVLKQRCASVVEVSRTASPLGAKGGGRSLSATATPRWSAPATTLPKFRPPKSLPIEPDPDGLAFVLDGVTYRRSLQDVISMKTMLFKLKRILQQDEFSAVAYSPAASPGHARSFLWPSSHCSNCNNLLPTFKTQMSKRHSAHFPMNESHPGFDPATLIESTTTDPETLAAENQELRNQMAFLSQKLASKDRTIALLQQQMVKYSHHDPEQQIQS